ncbi:uncharacterized protein LDX57_012761 [Aspergillus melleus]|uniref:uncharacterized protein n=1 Tax=Aspergillus melleus TaxID=138277 RepID=UPI001E8EE0B1|nr:uncharacterized protein LDX57_012761 [Aspergillus melleus]KAH8435132.1 hypothetical protein LDX57_012761 [Aspergillus melleus]
MASLLRGATKGVVDTAEKTTSVVDNNLKDISDSLGGNTAKDTTSSNPDKAAAAAKVLKGGAAPVLHVYSYDGQTKVIKEKVCIAFSNVDEENMDLSDIRELLIGEKSLEPRLLTSSFTNQCGAKVADTTSFKTYLQILNEKATELGDKAQDKAGTYRVYLRSKKILETNPYYGLLERGERVAVDKKILDLPVAQQPKQVDGTTSFSHNIFLNPTTTFSIIHPADMSEKHWSVVMRNNSLLHSYRVVDHNGEKFVERSLYPSFVLKPRNFWNYQISATAEVDSISDQRQSLRIPRFQIEDDSYIRQYETKQSVSRAIAQACLSETDAKLAIEGGAFGYSASASGSWSESHSSASGSSTSQDSRVMTITYNFPRVIIDFDPSSLDLSEECKADLEGVNTAEAVEAFKNKYGRFFATRIELGGRLHSSEEIQSTDAAASAQQAKSMRAAAALSFSAPWAQASASASHNNSSSSSSESKESVSHSAISWEAQGGDTLQCNNPPAWAYTVGSFYNWRAIKKSKVLALEEIISMVPGYQDTKVKFATLLAAAAKPEQEKPDVATAGRVIKFRLSTAMDDVVVPPTGEDINIGDILQTLMKEDSVLTSERVSFLMQLGINRENSVPLQCVKSESGPTAFSITTSAELPEAKLVYNQLYKIQTTDAAEGQWLGVNPVKSGFLTKTLIWAGDEEDATFFAFLPINDGSKNNYIAGDRMVMIALYDKNLDRIGLASSMSSNIGNDVERVREGIYFNVDYIES